MYDNLYEYLHSYGYTRENFMSIDLFDGNHFIAMLDNRTRMSKETQTEIEKRFEAKYGVKLDICGNMTGFIVS